MSQFNHRSLRAEKSRIGVHLSQIWRVVIGLGSLGLLTLGAVVLVEGIAAGWLLIGLAPVGVMLLVWHKGELRKVPLGSGQSIDALLASDVLGRLPDNPSPRQIAEAASKTNSGRFMAVRFGLSYNFLVNITSEDTTASEEVWQHALAIRDQAGAKYINGSVLTVALTRSFNGYETLLNHMKFEFEDIVDGVRWYDHINDLVRDHSRFHRTGGLARDWSFGYIPLLERFGHNISQQVSRGGLLSVDLEAHRDALSKMVDTFTMGGRQNMVLVGPSGVGKTTVVHAFAEKLMDGSAKISNKLKFRQVFILDSAALIAAAPGRGELENLIMRVLGEAYSAKNIILCLDDAQLFFEEGVGSVDISNVLQPILEAGNVRMILTMDEQRLLQIGQRNPSLVNALNRINVPPTNKEETLRVLQDKLLIVENQQRVVYAYHALLEAYTLSERYVHDLSMPGRAFKLLESAASYNEGGLVTTKSVQSAIEQTMGVKVGTADDAGEREKLLNLEDLIHQRMINQTRAVGVVSDALRRARAGVRNQDRPIGTFLFLGPTGVGKTELSKALADVYFGGEGNIVRLDLNEFVQPTDVYRLIADGANDPLSLTAQVMKQPFSVVLLDEIEKAHPQVLTTLLQLLDEGILRDEKNREVSFRDAIIIATSNAGADRIREYIERGYALEQFEQQFLDELINTNQFRPEFLNRFDEIVTFRPLSKDELLQVVDLILRGINKTLAPQKVVVNVDQDAKLYLVDKGYDPRLGARPMRRVVQRAVENTVARQMLSGTAGAGSTIPITLDQVRAILDTEQTANQIQNGQQ